MFGRRKVATLVAEFLGTGVITLLILSVQRSTIGVPFFVALAAGFALALVVYCFGSLSTGFYNPAVTLALWTVRRLTTLTAIVYIVAQFLGAWGAYWLYRYYVKSSLQPVGGHASARIFVAEMIGTLILSLGLAAVVYRRFTAGVSAGVAGLAYVAGIIAASPAAIGLLNPAVALGVRAWVWSTYVAGPVVGALVGVNLYRYVLAPVAVDELVAEAAVTPASEAAVATPAARRRTARPARAKAATKRRSTRR